jgi:hypothetical protein
LEVRERLPLVWQPHTEWFWQRIKRMGMTKEEALEHLEKMRSY